MCFVFHAEAAQGHKNGDTARRQEDRETLIPPSPPSRLFINKYPTELLPSSSPPPSPLLQPSFSPTPPTRTSDSVEAPRRSSSRLGSTIPRSSQTNISSEAPPPYSSEVGSEQRRMSTPEDVPGDGTLADELMVGNLRNTLNSNVLVENETQPTHSVSTRTLPPPYR